MYLDLAAAKSSLIRAPGTFFYESDRAQVERPLSVLLSGGRFADREFVMAIEGPQAFKARQLPSSYEMFGIVVPSDGLGIELVESKCTAACFDPGTLVIAEDGPGFYAKFDGGYQELHANFSTWELDDSVRRQHAMFPSRWRLVTRAWGSVQVLIESKGPHQGGITGPSAA